MNKVVERLISPKEDRMRMRKGRERGNRRNKFTEMLLNEIKCRKAGESRKELRVKTLEDSAVKRWKKRKGREQKGTNITVERWIEQSTERRSENAERQTEQFRERKKESCLLFLINTRKF